MGHRIRGLETEYGLAVQALTSREVAPGLTEDFWRPLGTDEAARHFFRPMTQQLASTNAWLRNGGRLYLDVGSHPEYATCECDRISDLIAHDRAGDRLVDELAEKAISLMQEEGMVPRVQLYKNNTDSRGNSYGSHENYQVTRELTVREWATCLTPFLVTRQLLCGAGKWVLDETGKGKLWLSQRAAHMWDPVASTTTRSRPLVNTRDEPHADPTRFRRLHVMVGDSNLAQPTLLLRLGATELVLRAIEDGHRFEEIQLADPATAIREVARHRNGRARLELASGRVVTTLDILDHVYGIVACYADDHELNQALSLWQTVMGAVADNAHCRIERSIDWAIKERLMLEYARRHQLTAHAAVLAELDLAYHDVHRGGDARARGLFAHAEVAGHCDTVVDENDIDRARTHPAPTTRARLRGRLITAASSRQRAFSCDWTSFTCRDLSDGHLEMLDPACHEDPRVDALIARMDAEPRSDSSRFSLPSATDPLAPPI